MKREFLQSLQVGESPLPKEIIDAIMAENGRDIEAVKSRYADYEELKQQLAQGQTQWQEQYDRMAESHRKELEEAVFGHNLEMAILAAQGRNSKAIAALLDIDGIKASENQPQALEEALQILKQNCDYLFQSETPPPFARSTGAATPETHKTPATLAGALLEKFERK